MDYLLDSVLACAQVTDFIPAEFYKLQVARLFIGGTAVVDATIAAVWTTALTVNKVATEDLYLSSGDTTPGFQCIAGGTGNFVTDAGSLEFDEVICKNRKYPD